MSTTPKSNRTTHTPGPWKWEPGDECIHADNGNIFVAWLPSSKASLKSRVVRADARLIAAAPDLLAALKSIMQMVEECGYGGSNSAREKSDAKAAREAIAKAEGK